MDEKSLYAHILNLTSPWQVRFPSMKMTVPLPLLSASLQTLSWPARPVQKPALCTITATVNGVTLTPASSPRWLKQMCPA